MKMSRMLASCRALALTTVVSLSFVFAVQAKTVYVDCQQADYTGHDGSSPALALRTLQEGVNAAAAGDVVSVAPGVYREGICASTTGHAAYRVCIDKPLTLKGAGRDVTHIVGEKADTANFIGAGAVGGVLITIDGATGTRIEGFTIRDCADSLKSNGSDGTGTAVHSQKSGDALVMADRPWIVDCAISNIYAKVGAVDYVNAARTIFQHCIGYNFASVGDRSDFIYCLVAHQGQDSNRHTFRGNKTPANGNRIVNCTVWGASANVNTMSTGGPYYLHNSILEYGGVNSVDIDSCVLSQGRGSFSGVTPGSTNETATSVFDRGDGVVAAGVLNDFRLVEAATLSNVEVSASPAIGLGNTNNLSAFPEEFRWKDVYGNAVVPDAQGRIHAGAVQATMKPVTGFKVSDGNAIGLRVNGERALRSVARTYYSDVWPVMYRLEVPKDTEYAAWGLKMPVFGLWTAADGKSDRYVFGDENGRHPLVTPEFRVMELATHLATHCYYVDRAKETGEAGAGSGTEANPYARIQRAIDDVPSGVNNRAVVFVAPGTYDKDLTTPGSPNPKCRLYFTRTSTHYRLVGTGGAERTIIPGAADTSEFSVGGCLSTNAIRCVHVGNSSTIVLQGFTLTGGHTAKGGEPMSDGRGVGSGNSYGRGGAFWAANSPYGWLIECIVTNNTAYYGGAAIANGNAVKCLFADNHIVSGGCVFDIQNSGAFWRLSSCVVNERLTSPGEVFLQENEKGFAVNCTVLGSDQTTFFGANSYSFFLNSILVHALPQSAAKGYRRVVGTYVWDFNYAGGVGNMAGVNYFKADPQFADEANGDYHLLPTSPAVGGGIMWKDGSSSGWAHDQSYRSYYRFLSCDREGNWPTFVNGLPTAGAYQLPSDKKIRLTVSTTHAGEVSVTPAPGQSVIATDEPVTITAADGIRQVVGLRVNGVLHPNVKTVTFTPRDLGGAECLVEVVANTNWYVDAVSGDDSRTGWSEESAMLTMTGVLARAVSGDVVTALPGTYDKGSALHKNIVYYYGKVTDTIRLPSRAVIPEGVTLVSRDGAAVTTIKGELGSGVDGTGEGAMRCVFLGRKAILRGFTLTGGSTLRGDLTYQKEFFDNVSGGAILSADLPGSNIKPGSQIPVNGYAEDCIITGNSSCGQGVTYFGSYSHCRITDNLHCAAREPQCLYGCVIGRNLTGNIGEACYQPYYVESCTFLGGDVKSDGSAAASVYVYPGSAIWVIRNSLFLGTKASTVKFAFNCIGKHPGNIYHSNDLNCWEGVTFDSNLSLDDDYRPVRTCSAVDAWVDPRTAVSNVFHYTLPAAFVRESDFAGGQRVYNGCEDVGAGEHDWRGRYRDVLSRSGRQRVTEASPGVVEGADGVVLADGETMTCTYRSPSAGSGICAWTVALEGGGSLKASVNGAPAQTLVAGSFSPVVAEGANEVVFTYTGEGAAVVKKFFSNVGGLVIVR